MSFFVAGAVVVSAGVAAYSSNKASKQQAKGVQKGLDQSAALAAEARADAMRLFERSSLAQRGGLESAFNFYKEAAQRRINPYIQGNQAAQAVIGQGAVQANNAIIGLPMDMSFTQQPQVQVPQDYLGGAILPAQQPISQEPVVGPEEQLENPNMIGAQKMSTADKTIGAETAFMDKIAKNDPVAKPVINAHKKLKNKIKKLF